MSPFTPRKPDLSQWIAGRLASIETRPGMWGPLIAVECQYLLLLEVLIASTAHSTKVEDEIRAMRRKWCDVIHAEGYNPSVALSDQIGDLEFDTLIEALKKLRQEIP